LAEGLRVNQTLRTIALTEVTHFGAPAYEAFSAMLRVNTNLDLAFPKFETAGADERHRESRKQMKIEHRLNKVGCRRLDC
jgi:hypothetical protein